LWNSLIRLGFFSIITLLLSQLRSTLQHQTELARRDGLTGAVNSRFFAELLQMEMERSQRYSHTFTLVYIDLDNFKTVNDQYGHSIGDRVLSSVVDCANRHLRKVDVIARLGGDEYALLLPETGEGSARATLSKLHSELVQEMKRNNWSVTFSIGAIICDGAHSSADQLIGMADNLMYAAKRDGKNVIKYLVCAD
jgi:diguanylate cyclase (GGDEF)-like protein